MGRNGAAPDPRPRRPQELLDWLLRNGRRERLCGEVASISGAPHALVEDALQEVCLLAVTTGKCRGRSEGEVYKWLRRATLRRVKKLLERAHRRHEVLVDWRGREPERAQASEGADVEVLAREKVREVAELTRTVLAGLSERQRRVAALHGHGLDGGEIARQLHTSKLRVKHLKRETLARARESLVAAGGGGCEDGERLVSRLAFGLASQREHTQAELHMAGCERCTAVYHRLELFHDKVAALLPLPAAAQADPGLLERGLHKTADALAGLKQHASDAGAQAKQQLVDAGVQAKQHVTAGYTRAVEYTPLASLRPGAAAAAVAGCLAIGGGAGYCIDKGVDPITGLVDVVQPAPAKPAQEPPQQNPPQQQPPDPPQLATPTPPPAPVEPAPPAPVEPTAPQQPAAPPEPPPEPTPAAVQFGEPATPPGSASAPQSSPTPQKPAPVPESGGTDLYGP